MSEPNKIIDSMILGSMASAWKEGEAVTVYKFGRVSAWEGSTEFDDEIGNAPASGEYYLKSDVDSILGKTMTDESSGTEPFQEYLCRLRSQMDQWRWGSDGPDLPTRVMQLESLLFDVIARLRNKEEQKP